MSVNATQSITASGGSVTLVNDIPAPGALYFYGTNDAGVRGWFPLAISVTGVSGALASLVMATGAAAVAYTNVRVAATGQANVNYTDTRVAASGQALVNLIYGGDANLSGNLASTGSQAWNAANNNGINLSGRLAQTGQALVGLVYGGDANLSGQLAAQIQSAAGVLSLNGVSGLVTLGGTNGVLVSVSGTTIWVSGTSGYNAAVYATIANLASTGQQAWSAANNNGINLSGNLTQTGVQLQAQIAGLSGIAVQTGNLRGYANAVTVGLDFLSVTFTPAFPGVPSVVPALLTSGAVGYLVWPSGITANGYTAMFSATTADFMTLETIATYRV